jgi:thiamine pyrophosphate-dependent acetolactate synthase large subunit-like protein
MYGYEVVARTVASLEFDHVFGVMGNGNLSWLSYGVAEDLFNYVPVRREDAAVAAAAGFARSTGRVGLATVTHGPGLGNAFTALVAAVKDNSPIVVLIGVPALSNSTALQRMDHPTFTMLTGASYHAVETPDKLSTTIVRARLAAHEQKRPQVVGFYCDHFEAEVAKLEFPFSQSALPESRSIPDAESIAEAVGLIAAAQKPLIVFGQGASFSGARAEVEQLGDMIGAVFADTMLGRHGLSAHPFMAGMIGISSHPMTDRFIADTDLVLVVGASMNFSQTRRFKLFNGKKVILIENDVSRTPSHQPLDMVLVGDARATLEALAQEWERRGLGSREGARTEALAKQLKDFKVYSSDEDTSGAGGVDPRAVYAALDAQLPADRLIVTDGGRVIETLHHILTARNARSYLYCSGFATIGLGLAMSIGAGHANPGRPLLHVTGDGGFMMSAQELDTVVRSGMQMLVMVMNDSQYGSEIRHIAQLGRQGHNLSVEAAKFKTPYLDALARAYGGNGEVLETKADVANFKITPEKLNGLYLVDVRVAPRFDPWQVWAASKFQPA